MTRASYEEAAARALRLVTGIVGRHGPRLSGTEGSRAAAAELAEALRSAGCEVREEPFDLHPGSLHSIGRVFALAYLAGLASMLLGPAIGSALVPGIGFLAMLIGAVFCVSQFILYLDLFDPLFPKVEGLNLVGLIEPRGPALRQLLLVAHHDSSPVYPFHERLAPLFPLRLFLPMALYLLGLAASGAAALSSASGGAPALPPALAWTLVLGLALVAPMFWYVSRRGSPGAGDNLIGCAIAIELAALFGSGPGGQTLRYGASAESLGRLSGTRLIVLLTDGEEAGQKGAKSFIRGHLESLKSLPLSVINFDSVYEAKDLALLERDRNGLTPLSATLARRLLAVAAERGLGLRPSSVPFGGGGTDAAQFARAGLETASIIGMPTGAFRKEILIHTMEDLPERIDAEAVSAVLETVGEYAAGD